MTETEMHYRIILRGEEVTYVLVREGGSYYDKFNFLTEDRYPPTAAGLTLVKLMVEAVSAVYEASR